MRVIFRKEADDDLLRIADYITRETGSASTGFRVARRIKERCRHLASLNGTLGRDRGDLKPGLRSIAEGNHVIFFFYRNKRMEVAAVVEGHRDLDAYFGEDGGET